MGGLTEALDQAAHVYDEPLYDSSAFAVGEVAALARPQVKVVLTGDGGDEIFGGYGWDETIMRYEAMRAGFGPLGMPLLSALYRGVVAPLSERAFASRAAGSARLLAADFADRYFPVRGFFSGAEQKRVLGREPEDAAWLFRKFDRPDLPMAHRVLYLDLHTYLPDNGLMQVDRSTMAVGLEARVPLLDQQLVEYAFSLPPERLLRPGATKIAFRDADRALAAAADPGPLQSGVLDPLQAMGRRRQPRDDLRDPRAGRSRGRRHPAAARGAAPRRIRHPAPAQQAVAPPEPRGLVPPLDPRPRADRAAAAAS